MKKDPGAIEQKVGDELVTLSHILDASDVLRPSLPIGELMEHLDKLVVDLLDDTKTSNNSMSLKKALNWTVYDAFRRAMQYHNDETIVHRMVDILLVAIRSGACNSDSKTGMYMLDSSSYMLLLPIVEQVIRLEHSIPDGEPCYHPASQWAADDEVRKLDRCYVKTVRVRVARNMTDAPFLPLLGREDAIALHQQIHQGIAASFKKLGWDHGYYTHSDNEKRTEKLPDYQLFGFPADAEQTDEALNSVGAYSYPGLPIRGSHFNGKGTGIVWEREEDVMRLICVEHGADLQAVNRNARELSYAISQNVQLAHHEVFGYLSSCPTNAGSGVRMGVH